MDLFKFGTVGTYLDGQAINGYEGVTWVERYREPGEFEIKARLSSGLREFLPLDTIISHMNTLETMIVENHEIVEEPDTDPELTISGRSFETILENRIVGQNQDWTTPPASMNDAGYELFPDTTWWQANQLINDHVRVDAVLNPDDALPNVMSWTDLGGVGPMEPRIIKRGDLHKRLIELLAIDDLGIKIRRANMLPGTETGEWTRFIIHGGVDRRNTVTFSAQTGDISTANYLWTRKKMKNAALVSGKFVETMVYGAETGYARRVMFVDASDIDGSLSEVPTGSALTDVRNAMGVRGRQALASQREIILSSVNVSENYSYRYRTDYDVGDVVSLDGSFGETLSVRVVEYAEIEDKNGVSGYPTLSILEL